MDTLVVDLNRTKTHSIEVAAPSFTTDGPFEVVLDNHGAALHVYLQLDDDLARAVALSAGNHFVEQGSLRRVSVDVNPRALPVRGRMKIVTGYGAETEYLTVSVEEPTQEERGVDVDESLAEPRPRPEPRSGGLDLAGLPVLVLGGLAVVVALLAALALGGNLALLAVLVVLVAAGVGVALVRG